MTLSENKRFWEFRNAVGDNTAELILYGDISSYQSWWGDNITPQEFSDELNALGDIDEIIVRINSAGGCVSAAVAIYTRLKSHKAKITVIIDGIAASAATVVAMAGDTIKIPAAGMFMIHDPIIGMCGYYGKGDLEKAAEVADTVKNSIIAAYALKTKLDTAELSQLMSDETWLTGADAVTAGFCDEVLFSEPLDVAAFAGDLSRYKNAPKKWVNSVAKPPLLQNSGEIIAKGNSQMEIKTVEELKAKYPELTAAIEQTAFAVERKRIQDIEGAAVAGFEEILNKAKFTEPVSAAEAENAVAKAIIAAQKAQGANHLTGVAADVQASGMSGIGSGETSQLGGESAANVLDKAIDEVLGKGGTDDV
jgi:ATP-dependent protease ClpP protease subunit